MAQVELRVDGMTCRSCEVRLGRALRRVPGVLSASASAARGVVRVTTHAAPDADLRAALDAAVVGAGYAVGRRRAWVSRDRDVWRDVGVVLGLVALARVAGLEEATGRLGEAAMSGSLVLVVLLGVAAGLSTCMALVGGLVLGVAARHAERHPEATRAQRLRPPLAFGAGRLAGFAVGGLVLGLVGSAVQLSGGAVALLTLVVSAAMVAVGLQLTGVSPRLAGLSPALPAAVARLVPGARPGSGPGPYSDARAAGLGAATFLLPCGFTQAVQLYALSTGAPLRAAVVMALFAVGTAPGLLGLGGLTSAVRGRGAPRFFRLAGVVVLAFAAVNVTGALTVLSPGLVAGLTGGLPASAASASSSPVAVDGDVQVLRTTQVAGGYEPAVATVAAGTPVRWEVDSQAASCASALYAPELGVDGVVLLEPGVNVLELGALEEGRYFFSCAMGMYVGAIDVVAS